MANPDHEVTGRTYASILSATQSRLDIARAKQWYEHHKTNETAWFVIADMLDLSYWHSTKPDVYAVEQAKLLLADESFRRQKPRLVGALVSARVENESVSWGRRMNVVVFFGS
jgi:hypothetical protein